MVLLAVLELLVFAAAVVAVAVRLLLQLPAVELFLVQLVLLLQLLMFV